MKLFETIIDEVRAFADARRGDPLFRERDAGELAQWPSAEGPQVVLGTDTGAELGSPAEESVSFLVWTTETGKIADRRVTLLGPDIGESEKASLPFGSVILLRVGEFSGDECRGIHRDLELARFDLRLSGYMMRAASRRNREWIRIHRDAAGRGWGLFMMGRSLLDRYAAHDRVVSAEVIFVTSGAADVRALGKIGEKAESIIAAMNRMHDEMSFDCGSCDYSALCGEVAGLKSMRDALRKEEGHGAGQR